MTESLEGGKTRGALPQPPPPGVPSACGEGEDGQSRSAITTPQMAVPSKISPVKQVFLSLCLLR